MIPLKCLRTCNKILRRPQSLLPIGASSDPQLSKLHAHRAATAARLSRRKERPGSTRWCWVAGTNKWNALCQCSLWLLYRLLGVSTFYHQIENTVYGSHLLPSRHVTRRQQCAWTSEPLPGPNSRHTTCRISLAAH